MATVAATIGLGWVYRNHSATLAAVTLLDEAWEAIKTSEKSRTATRISCYLDQKGAPRALSWKWTAADRILVAKAHLLEDMRLAMPSIMR